MNTCYRHADRETLITCTRCGNFICPECMVSAPVGFQCVDCVKATPTPKVKVGFSGSGSQLPVVTKYLIGLCLGAFLYSVLNPSVINNFAMFPPAIASGEWWRLLTAAFLHGGFLHIAFNMYALYWLGPQLERVLGRVGFASVYLLSALGGNVASYYFSELTTFSVGASGAIFGLMTATIVIGREFRADVSQLTTLLVINVVIGFMSPSIDWRAHLGGALVGAVAGYLMTNKRNESRILAMAGIAALLVVLVILRNQQIISAFNG